MNTKLTIKEILNLKESEDKVEFKEAKGGNYSYNGGNKIDHKERRRCILGYVTALANEGGGYLVFGISDKYPHKVVGTNQSLNEIGILEQHIYRDIKIRPQIYELYENDLRVLVIEVPSRPIGKVLTCEDIPLMRVGEELLRMPDEHYLKIISEQEPDYSDLICEKATINDLDDVAIDVMKRQYSTKQNNPLFLTLSNEQILNDLNLTYGNKIKYAAIILLGKQSSIKEYLPQSEIRFEYRNFNSQINFDKREILCKPYFIMIDELWEFINLRNGNVPVQEGSYIFDIPYFNQEVIREGINNAISHRDYRKQSEVVIKQSPFSLEINSPGGFPLGVNINNLLSVNSTLRNRLLADVMAKTGAVERSGQGIDKMFFNCISEAKMPSDFSSSDNYQVSVLISATVKDKAFAIFIKATQENRSDNDKLSLSEILTLDKIRRKEESHNIDKKVVDKLLNDNLIEKITVKHKAAYRLSKDYYSFVGKEGIYTKETPFDKLECQMLVISHLSKFKSAKMSDFVDLLSHHLSREQTKNLIYEYFKNGVLEAEGKGKGRTYTIGIKEKANAQLFVRAFEIGFEKMIENGEVSPDILNEIRKINI